MSFACELLLFDGQSSLGFWLHELLMERICNRASKTMTIIKLKYWGSLEFDWNILLGWRKEQVRAASFA